MRERRSHLIILGRKTVGPKDRLSQFNNENREHKPVKTRKYVLGTYFKSTFS